jgi:putative salt-induced outer membrane protein YdiY
MKHLFNQTIRIASLIIVLSTAVLSPAAADEIVLDNGDRLTGRIIAVKDGILTLETSYSEPIKITFSSVREMTSTQPVALHLDSGEVIKGTIRPLAEHRLEVAAGPDRESVVVNPEMIVAVNPPPKPPVTWKGSVTMGGNLQDGNTKTMNLSIGAQAIRRSENDRISANFLYNRAEEDGSRTAENTFGQLKYDYFLTTAWYLLLDISMLVDEFRDINLRTVVGPGIGYQVWEEEDKALGLEAGVSYFSEDRVMAADDDWLTARLAANFMYRVFKSTIFTDQLTIYPSLDKTGEYTLRNEAALATGIGADWAFKLSNIWERDSDPAPDIKKDDLTWILGLQYSF